MVPSQSENSGVMSEKPQSLSVSSQLWCARVIASRVVFPFGNVPFFVR